MIRTATKTPATAPGKCKNVTEYVIRRDLVGKMLGPDKEHDENDKVFNIVVETPAMKTPSVNTSQLGSNKSFLFRVDT